MLHHTDVTIRASSPADHHEPGRQRVPDPGGPQQPHHHAARRHHGASGTYRGNVHSYH